MISLLYVLATAPTPLLFSPKEIPGRYYEGDGLGSNNVLELRSDGRFDYTLSGCLGVYEKAKGSWRLQGDLLTLTTQKARPEGMNHRFVPIKWGERILLVDEHGVPGFAAWAREPDDEQFPLPGQREYTKMDAKFEPGKRYGKPVLPVRYRLFYQKGSIQARVVRLERGGRAVLDRGKASGIRPGLRLTAGWWAPEVEVLQVGEKTSVAKVLYSWGTTERLKVGKVLSTGGEWVRPTGSGFRLYESWEQANRPKAKSSRSGRRS